MPPLSLLPFKLPLQGTPRITAIHRSLTVTARNSTSIEPRHNHPSQSQSPLIPTNMNSSISRIPRSQASTSSTFTSTSTSTTSNQFNLLLNALTAHLTTSPRLHLPTLHSLLRSYTSHTPSWSAYAHVNPLKQYTRNLVTEVPGVFNLLLLVWTPGMRSPVHDHAGSHCLMKILQGGLREVRYAMPEEEERGQAVMPAMESGRGGGGKSSREGLREISRTDFEEGKVAYISDRLGLHEIINPSAMEYAVSLHLYTPPNAATHGCHVYDPATGESRHVMQGAYDSVRGVVGGA